MDGEGAAGSTHKSVLFINRVYPPDVAATGQLLAELATGLHGLGWQVTVVTSRSTKGADTCEHLDGVSVERVSGLPFTRASHWRRLLSYVSLYPALLWRALRLPKADVVVTMTDPPLQLLLGVVLKRFRKARLVHWAQDIYPELAEALGVLPANGIATLLLRRLSTWGLKHHDHIVTVGECMQQRLVERGIDAARISVIPNWADHQLIHPIAHDSNPFRQRHGLQGRFVVMYSGNLGLAHDFMSIVDAAELLQQSLPEVLFLFVGEGPQRAWLIEQIKTRRLENIRLLPPQSKHDLAASLGAADLHLVSMRQSLVGLLVPSKVYGILAAGRPLLFLGPESSEVARLVASHDCGEVLANVNGAELADRIDLWRQDGDRRAVAGDRARQAAGTYSTEVAVKCVHKELQRLR